MTSKHCIAKHVTQRIIGGNKTYPVACLITSITRYLVSRVYAFLLRPTFRLLRRMTPPLRVAKLLESHFGRENREAL